MSSAPDWAVGWFNLGRLRPYPSIYPEWKFPVTQDVLVMGWVAAFVALLLSFYIVIPASNKKISRFIRVTIFLLLGLSIMLCNFGQGWEVGKITTKTQYRAGTAEHIKADVGVYLSLRSVNITLKGRPINENSSLAGETIDYNERFTWTWAQGRPGLGPFAGQIQRDFRAAQYRGAPYPILWIAEYFTFDGEGIRFGRYYRTSGWYAHIFIWTAFPMWLMTVFLFKMIVRYGAIALTITGILMFIPPLIWAGNRNPIELQIPFEDAILRTSFGWCWYVALCTGIGCILSGVSLYILDGWYYNELSGFFGTNPWKILDVEDEIVENKKTEGPTTASDIEMDCLSPAEPNGCTRQVTVRGRGTSSRNQGSKQFEFRSESGSTSSQGPLETPAVSPTHKFQVTIFDESGQQQSRCSRDPEYETIKEASDDDEDDANNENRAQGLQAHNDDDIDQDDISVFESSPITKTRGSQNLSPINKEF